MEKILILHAWYEKPDSQWYPWLEKELEKKGYTVFIPEIPTFNSDLPDPDKAIKLVANLADNSTSIVGHSLGGVLGLRLGEMLKFHKLITVAAWDYDDLYPQHKLFWKNKIRHELIKKNVRERIIIHSDNDTYLTSLQAENMSKRLEGKFILVKGAGHFSQKDGIHRIPQILQFFRRNSAK